MKRFFVVGNWKMHTSPKDSLVLASAIAAHPSVQHSIHGGVRVGVCPPFTSLAATSAALAGSSIELGAQNCHTQPSGAFTGEISAPMLAMAGCSFVLAGHSERRVHCFENDALVSEKAKAIVSAGLQPIVCVGETLQERESESTFEVVRKQLSILLSHPLNLLQHAVVAYEPVWAIGTGLAATPEQAEEVHAFVCKELADRGYDVPVIYGGSVNENNAADLFAMPHISGALVGGASLHVEQFASIVSAAHRALGAGA